MIFDIFREGFSSRLIINLMVRVFVMFCVLPIHEFAHALVAYWLGDKTAKYKGRMTINPLAHLDPFGCLLVIIAGFGYAKPVPINPRNFKNPKVGMALTAVAGPLSNVIMAIIWMIASLLVQKNMTVTDGTFAFYLATFFMETCVINITLAVFNILPVPPLDGSRILQLLIPDKYYFKFARYERYMVYGVLALVLFGVLDYPIRFCSNVLTEAIFNLARVIVGV